MGSIPYESDVVFNMVTQDIISYVRTLKGGQAWQHGVGLDQELIIISHGLKPLDLLNGTEIKLWAYGSTHLKKVPVNSTWIMHLMSPSWPLKH